MRNALSIAFIVAVSSASTLSADEVRLVGGDVLKGTVVSETETAVTIDHAALGRIEIARDRIAEVIKTTPTPPPAPAAVATTPVESTAAPAPAVPVAVLPAPVPPPPAGPDGSWKFSLSLGFTGSENETQSNWDLRLAGSAKRETEADRTTISAEYYFNTVNSTNTDNNLLVTGLEEFLFKDSKWEAFIKGTYQYDEFQSWEQRAGLYAGPAYRLFEGEPLELKLRAGAGASYEFADSTWTPELLLGDDLVWKIDDRSKLTQGLDFYPDIDNFGEYRLTFRLDYEIALSPKGDLKGTAGIRDEYDSYVEPSGDSSNDLKVYAGVKVDF
jgi:putative salt-induced outer membrane protein YdiY